MTKTIYLKNENAEDDEWWKNKILKPILDMENFIKGGVIKKNGCYYPRLMETNKRGLHAFNEVHNTHFKDIEKDYILILCKFKVSPQVNINTLIITYEGNTHHLENYLEKYKIIKSETPFNAIINDLNIMSSKDKLEQIENMIENLEFTPYEYSLLIIRCSSALADYHK
jgi:hypothetical protein